MSSQLSDLDFQRLQVITKAFSELECTVLIFQYTISSDYILMQKIFQVPAF